MAGLLVPPDMQQYYGIDATGNPTGVSNPAQPTIPPASTPTATGKGPGAATGKGPVPGAMNMPGAQYAQGRPGDPNFFQQDPMASRGVQSMGLANPFYMANVADLARPQMAGQASYMRQMAGLGQQPMAQAPTVSPMPPAQFPQQPPPATFGGMPPPATGKGSLPATGKMPQSGGSTAPVAGGKMPSSGGSTTPETGGGYMPPQTPSAPPTTVPSSDIAAPAVMPTTPEYSPQEPISGGGMATQVQGPVMEKQAGGSTYGFDSSQIQDAQNEMIRRAIDAAAGVGPKS